MKQAIDAVNGAAAMPLVVSVDLDARLEEIDDALTEALWAAATDPATPAELLESRVYDLVDDFLSLAEETRTAVHLGTTDDLVLDERKEWPGAPDTRRS
ncbi:MAG: hypothetical protein QOF33_1844 [Thermomicrobiales bacterium]|nr:hypothetical protein [Thermomicrobiales bacterium]MEA2583759.1 hypothetical protein [Thermomicrobiales bacterium]MEA2593656.1 hypothetical protein [Thermomicrobiales bacterium]